MTDDSTLQVLVLPRERDFAGALLDACERADLVVPKGYDDILRVEHSGATEPVAISTHCKNGGDAWPVVKGLIDKLRPIGGDIESRVTQALGRSSAESAIVVGTVALRGCASIAAIANLANVGMISLREPIRHEDLTPKWTIANRTIKFRVVPSKVEELRGHHALRDALMGMFCDVKSEYDDDVRPTPPRRIGEKSRAA